LAHDAEELRCPWGSHWKQHFVAAEKETIMKRLPAMVLAASAALATPAFAAVVTYYAPPERVTTYQWDPVLGTYVQRTTVYYEEPAIVAYAEPPIIVTAPRLTEDQAITGEVIDRIASDPGISGRVGVDTYRNTVTLSGRVGTPWQADKAARHAQNTPGVREVNNELRARIGG
jgi:hypothetical protein